MKEYLFFYLGCYMLYSRDTRRREAGYRSPPQETESHKWINSCMSGLTHLFLWCAQTAVIFVPEIVVGIFTNSPRFNSCDCKFGEKGNAHIVFDKIFDCGNAPQLNGMVENN